MALSADGKTGLVVGYRGLVFMTTDSGQNWKQSNLDLQPREEVAAVVAQRGGQDPLVRSTQKNRNHDNGW